MEVAAAHEAEVALSDDLYRAAGSACSVFNIGILSEMLEAPIRGRLGSLFVWVWRSKAPERRSNDSVQAEDYPG
jgi:adenylate cyclase